MVLGIIVGVVVVAAAVAAYKLWKAGKAVTGKSVLATVESDAKAAVAAAKPAVEAVVEKVVK